VLARVGSALGALEGTGPEDDPLLRSQRRWGFDRGRARGLAEGRAQSRAEMARRILESRGVATSAAFADDAAVFAQRTADAIVDAAFACVDEADFRRRLRRGG